MSGLKVAAIQMCSGVDPSKNAADSGNACRRSGKARRDLYPDSGNDRRCAEDRPGLMSVLKPEAQDLIVKAASALAAKHSIFLHIGSTAIARGDGKIANRAFLFGPDGGEICQYDKIHMFDVDLDNGESWRESKVYHPGDAARVANLPFGKSRLCYLL